MEQPYRTPLALVQGLHERQPRARAVLFDLLRQPLERLMAELLQRHGLAEEPDLLVNHGLQHAETHLRFGPPDAAALSTWASFRASLLLHVAKLTVQPHGATDNGLAGPSLLPDSPQVAFETFFRPFARLGNKFFGGDWYAGRRHDDGSVWVFLADVTGHGFYAYLLACSLPALWTRCWQRDPAASPEPAEVLSAMHHLVIDCLPEGIFLECLLARIDATGRVTLSPAGGSRILHRQGLRPPGLVTLRGTWLGLCPPRPDEQRHFQLRAGDELLLTTDGVFDQLEEHGGMEGVALRVPSRRGSLFGTVRDLLERSLAEGPQKDDITMVLLRYEQDPEGVAADAEGDPITLPIPGGRTSAGRGDVPV